ncbi:MAG: molybdopterin-dependent oxidoreductase, partial [Bacteroidetes bacterium]|nr:molybdopterin-dependent oxidoreductase [Bacteroidota bacterium]
MTSRDRRNFIRTSSILGGSLFVAPHYISSLSALQPGQKLADRLKSNGWFRLGCPSHNCGGRCILKILVQDGIISRIETDDRPNDLPEEPQLRACLKGRAYRRRQYHPDRLRYPMKRTGHRGEGKFERISWDEATSIMADEIIRVKNKYGNEALYIPYGTGSYSQTNGRWPAVRLSNLIGGSLGFYNSYSWACISKATPTVYGTSVTGNQRQDWLNSKYIIMWGWNPAEMKDGTNSDYLIKLARKNGARVVCIDPRKTMSAVALADEWIPIRPGTDVAMMSAMVFVMMDEDLLDESFISSHCQGFRSNDMPAGYKNQESYADYILGTKDSIPKTPAWAEKITGIPAETIVRIAREYATIKPAMLYQGYGMQRRAYGEQVVRAGCVLAAISGNIGIHGGWASGMALQAGGGPRWSVFPTGRNPVRARIPSFLWTEAVIRGTELTDKEGLKGTTALKSNIKFIWAVASNALINQHSNINRTSKILKDETQVEFIAVQDQFLTPTGMYADLLLPACTQLETWGLEDGWKYGEEVILMPQIVEPAFESKSDYRICAEIAKKLDVYESYTQGMDEKAWTRKLWNAFKQSRFPDLPDFETIVESNAGLHSRPVKNPKISFEDFRNNPAANPLKTASGKVEIFSTELHRLNNPKEIPPIPKYIQEWESPFDATVSRFPLQVIGPHYMGRVHSTHANVDWLKEAFPQRIFINPIDAASRNIKDGKLIKAFN